MFTGIVEETGRIARLARKGGSVVFSIKGRKTVRDLGVNDSIAVDGVCLTVIRKRGPIFDVQAVEETLRKTNLGEKLAGDAINLERSLSARSRLGGHFVLGHVDTTGVIESIKARKSSWMFWIRVPKRFSKLLIPVGSVAIDGVSLTVAQLRGNLMGISIIPHTWEVTTFKEYRLGRTVNVELDMLGKYVQQLLKAYRKR
jgi:riboflavin synthase